MKMLILVLNKTNVLENLLTKFFEAGIKGSTIFNSTGMAQTLSGLDDGNFFASLKFFLDPEQDENYTIMTVLPQQQIETYKKVISEVVGDLSEPNTGVLFTLPVEQVEGLPK